MATSDRRRRPPPPSAASARPFPPTVDYAALEGLPGPARFVLATSVLPLDVAVTSVRILKNVELLLGELAVQLRVLRPAVAAAGRAYADGRFDPLLDTVEDVRYGTDAVVRAPFATVREVVLGPAVREPPEAHGVPAVHAVDPPPPPTLSGWLTGLGGDVGRRLGVIGVVAVDEPDEVLEVPPSPAEAAPDTRSWFGWLWPAPAADDVPDRRH